MQTLHHGANDLGELLVPRLACRTTNDQLGLRVASHENYANNTQYDCRLINAFPNMMFDVQGLLYKAGELRKLHLHVAPDDGPLQPVLESRLQNRLVLAQPRAVHA